MAESHFSSETQKGNADATIPNFHGEVGLNSDSFQLFHILASKTKKINFGTGIHNIVGGSGGPIASADRVNSLRFINDHLWNPSRILRIGIASGRFPYQNSAFGIVPRNETEEAFWPFIKRIILLEAIEIFLRLLRGETLSSEDIQRFQVTRDALEQISDKRDYLENKYHLPLPIQPRWLFDNLKLVPHHEMSDNLRIVLGSSDPLALDMSYRFWDVDLFNLSFTPPDQLDRLHDKMDRLAKENGRLWNRSRLPRTVLVFAHRDRIKAQQLAHCVLDAYIEAMRGTANVPDKEVLLSRALVGDADEIRNQLTPTGPRRFHPDDRLMLWFEFNQQDNDNIREQMTYFIEEVACKL